MRIISLYTVQSKQGKLKIIILQIYICCQWAIRASWNLAPTQKLNEPDTTSKTHIQISCIQCVCQVYLTVQVERRVVERTLQTDRPSYINLYQPKQKSQEIPIQNNIYLCMCFLDCPYILKSTPGHTQTHAIYVPLCLTHNLYKTI